MATVIYKDLATSTQRRNRFEIPLLAAILGTKFKKEQSLVHKTANSCATQNLGLKFLYKFIAFCYGQNACLQAWACEDGNKGILTKQGQIIMPDSMHSTILETNWTFDLVDLYDFYVMKSANVIKNATKKINTGLAQACREENLKIWETYNYMYFGKLPLFRWISSKACPLVHTHLQS